MEKEKIMLEIKGNYAEARIFSDTLDEASIAQIYQLCNQECVKDASIAIMSDVHMGSSCCVGTTMTIDQYVIPSLVGVDIGCGMEVVKLKEKHIELARLDTFIHQHIPSGCNIHKQEHKDSHRLHLENLYCHKAIDELRAKKSLGTLGGGNHFIEIDKDDDGFLYLIIHSGSRHLGVEVANHYQKLAYDELNGCSERDLKILKAQLKAEGNEAQYAKLVKTRKNTKKIAIPYLFSYLQGDAMQMYLHDMKLVQEFADQNRKALANAILKHMKLHVLERFTTIHNYIDLDTMILRKGAISAQKGEQVLIPMNMRDGSLLCVGKGNQDWNYSAPHGAGRAMSRGEAKASFTLSAYKQAMKGIYSTSVNQSTLDECPMAYKPMEMIENEIQDSVDIIKRLYPIYNFKAGSNE